MHELTIFRNRFDNKTHRQMQLYCWDSVVNLLQNLSVYSKEGKQDAELISPAIYKPDTTRSNKNVLYWGKWCAIDVDDYDGEIDDLVRRYRDYNFVLYSTASSRPEKKKFRIVFDCSRVIESEEIKHFWFALNQFTENIGDTQTSDLSRMYYVPARYTDADNFFLNNSGSALDVDKLLDRYPYVKPKGTGFFENLPESIQEQILEHRKSKLENSSIQWRGYMDCPFIPKNMVSEYRTLTSGWYHMMYRIMVATACNAVKQKYPLNEKELAHLCRQLDQDTGNWYENRPMEVEANSAIKWAYMNAYSE